jgi:hypothetical protein
VASPLPLVSCQHKSFLVSNLDLKGEAIFASWRARLVYNPNGLAAGDLRNSIARPLFRLDDGRMRWIVFKLCSQLCDKNAKQSNVVLMSRTPHSRQNFPMHEEVTSVSSKDSEEIEFLRRQLYRDAISTDAAFRKIDRETSCRDIDAV